MTIRSSILILATLAAMSMTAVGPGSALAEGHGGGSVGRPAGALPADEPQLQAYAEQQQDQHKLLLNEPKLSPKEAQVSTGEALLQQQ